MSFKTLVIIFGTVLGLILGYFALQLFSLPDRDCHPHIDGQCYWQMEQECIIRGMEYTGFFVEGAWCEGNDCQGLWAVCCDFSIRPEVHVICSDSWCWECVEL